MRMWFAILTLGWIGLLSGGAQEIELKGGGSVTGPIIVEKSDQVFVDLGFTILAIPRQQVVNIRHPQTEKEAAPAPQEQVPEVRNALYYTLREAPADRSMRDLVVKLGEAVVQVRTPAGLGSGFFLNEEGYLITNFHVIEGETEIGIEVYHQRDGQLDRRVYKEVRIIAMNKFEDLTLLKIEDEKAPKFAWAPLGQSDQLAVGERVFAIGSPLGLERTVTEGILSTKTREYQGKLYLQTTAQINPGNSGGPLFNLLGEVVGVTNMKIQFGEGIGFAIPVDAVKYFLHHRDAYAYDKENPSNPYRYLPPPSRMQAAAPTSPGQPSQNTQPSQP
jgi:serine protease Do